MMSPGIPSSDSDSVLIESLVLIWSRALPWRNTPYCSRKSKFVWNFATPQNSGESSSVSPVSRMKTAAPDAMLPSLMTVIEPEAASLNRLRVEPSSSVRSPISIVTAPRTE